MSKPPKLVPGLRPVVIKGTGSYVPEKIMTNADIEKIVDTTDEWIYTRTGMKERHIASDDQATSDLAIPASELALEDASVAAVDLDMILVCTSTPDMFFPNTGCFVQKAIGASGAFCMDMEAACSGFLYGLEIGRQFVQSGSADNVLVIGAEKISPFVNWEDRTTCVLFGDGAGAAVLQAGQGRGIMETIMGSDGSLADLLIMPGGGSRMPPTKGPLDRKELSVQMQGREVFKHAVSNMTQAASDILEHTGVSIEDVKYVIPHQANARIIQAIGQRLGAKEEQVYMNVDKYGNTSAASVILALDEASRAGNLEPGDLLLFVVFGAGFTWGAMLLEWNPC